MALNSRPTDDGVTYRARHAKTRNRDKGQATAEYHWQVEGGDTRPPPDYYAMLGIRWTASSGDVELAYRRYVVAHHPDKFFTQPEVYERQLKKLQALNSGMQILRDPAARRDYNDKLRNVEQLRQKLRESGSGDR